MAVGFLEVEPAGRGKRQALDRGLDPLRPGQRMGDGHAHVGRPELGQDRAVDIFDETVDQTLRMDQDGEPIRAHAEEMLGLDELEPLVHEGRGVDRDLGAHRPGRVADRLLGRHPRHLGKRAGAERAARCGQDDPPDARAALEHLEDCIVFGIDRQEHGAAARGGRCHQDSGRNQRLLVGKGDRRSGLDGGKRRGKAGRAHDGRDHEVGRKAGGRHQRIGPGFGLDSGAGKGRAQGGKRGRLGHHGQARPVPEREVRESLPIPASGQDLHPEPVRIAGDEVERRGADRAGRTKDDDTLHAGLPKAATRNPATAATGTRPSTRSIRPPCPGRRRPESFRPTRRLSQLS